MRLDSEIQPSGSCQQNFLVNLVKIVISHLVKINFGFVVFTHYNNKYIYLLL